MDGSAVRVVKNRVGIDSEFQIDTGYEVFRCVNVLDGRIALFVSRTYDLTAWRSAPCYQDRHCARPMIASYRFAISKLRDFWCATELAHNHDERRIEQAPIVEVAYECSSHRPSAVPAS